MTRKWLRLLVVPVFVAFACSGNTTTTPVTPTPIPTPTPTPTPTPPPLAPVVFVGAGDIADCANDGGDHAEATAKLIDSMSEAFVFTAGDNVYFDGTAAEFANCYGPRWGRFKNRTYPSPGNHEYQISITPYFDYFGDRAGARGAGFYSFKLGNWHIISLNSNVPVSQGSEQWVWLDNDLRTEPMKCTLAIWHHPLFTSGPSLGSGGLMRDVWRLLYDRGVDVVVNGHDHLYERFRAQDPSGLAGPAGIVQYTAGMGGAPLYNFGPSAPNSVAKLNRSYGVLRFVLNDVGWDSVFVEAGTGLQLDPVTGNLCH